MLLGFKKLEIRYSYPYILIFSLLLAGLLRFYQIGDQSLWLDESLSNWFSSITIHQLWAILLKRIGSEEFIRLDELGVYPSDLHDWK
jgi:hypothetical protein